jgi:Ni/Fe-hydrogenase 1 B-type cytochrome subunit
VERMEPVYQWSVAVRITHWAMALVITVLIVTGFYIASPFTVYRGETTDKFLMGDVRFWHLLAGVFFIFLFTWRMYLAFFSRFHADWRDFLAWIDVRCMWKQVKFYLLLTDEEVEAAPQCAYGYTQAFAYLALWIIAFAALVTGLILMGAEYHGGLTALTYRITMPVAYWMGGLATVRFIHHLLTWLFILFIMVHVYMAVWHDVVLKHAIISSMVSGWVYRKRPAFTPGRRE